MLNKVLLSKVIVLWLYLTFDDMDPPWINELIKPKIKWKNGIYKNYQNSFKSSVDLEILQNAISEVSKLIYEKKNDYHHQLAMKLIDPSTFCITYWSILKTFYNNKIFELNLNLFRLTI